MIPKVIHYCWFSGEKKPRLIQHCINSWKKIMPDYQIKCWDGESFDFDSVPFVKEAIDKKKWAFAADYVRLYTLYTEGGIYLDSDVEVFKRFDGFLYNDFFAGTEYGAFDMESAIMGAVRGNEYIKECMEFYQKKHFVQEDGSLDMDTVTHIMSNLLIPYGYRIGDKTQYLKACIRSKSYEITIYSTQYFKNSNVPVNKECYAYHHFANSWVEFKERGKLFHFCRRHELMYWYRQFEKMKKIFE